MCNHYEMMKRLEAMQALFHGLSVQGTNLAPLPDVFPDYPAPILRRGADGCALAMARWGLPTPAQYLVTKTWFFTAFVIGCWCKSSIDQPQLCHS